MIRWFLSYSYKYRYYLLAAGLLIPLVQFFRLARPTILKWVLEAGEKGDLAMAADYTLLFIVFIGVNHLLQYAQVLLSSYAGLKIVFEIRNALYEHLLQLPFPVFQDSRSGQMIVRLTNDVENVKAALSGGLIRVVSDILAIVGILVILITMNWQLSLYVIVAIPILLKVTSVIGGYIRKGMSSAKALLSKMTTAISEMIFGGEVLRGFGKEEPYQARFSGVSREFTDKYHQLNLVEPSYYGFVEFSGSFLLACIIYDGTLQIHGNTLSFAELVAYIAYVQSIMHPIRHLTGMMHNLVNAHTSMVRIFDIFNEAKEPELIEMPPAQMSDYSIEFENVHFSYGEEKVLKGLSFKIREGEKVALVGRTGAGKSTMIKLINRFYTCQEGQVKLGGQDVKNLPRNHLREHIGFILQDVYLFTGSLEENLALFNEERMERSGQHRRKLEQDGFFDMEGKEVVANGANFSLGEKQLMAFGRVFIKDAEIFLLDEATSNVDTQTEHYLQNHLDEFMEGKTALIIAHRLSTVRNADRILVLKDGVLVEDGTFEELVAKKGEFYEYFRHQDLKYLD